MVGALLCAPPLLSLSLSAPLFLFICMLVCGCECQQVHVRGGIVQWRQKQYLCAMHASECLVLLLYCIFMCRHAHEQCHGSAWILLIPCCVACASLSHHAGVLCMRHLSSW